ncbi:hypothetical protein EUGRSUZ_C01432 [Eucalyptus grandis]|uniref:Uncharacterized protein n=2 Tax=Eucalyptus grandis TaxID=71139 RepID=A0ACC3LCY2_EUCGR|nr:hypothetical protein EUGRSUZ_C01432 [Eucalyptus grandis]
MNIIKQIIATGLEQKLTWMLIVPLKTDCTKQCPEEDPEAVKSILCSIPQNLNQVRQRKASSAFNAQSFTGRDMACTTFGVDLNWLRQMSCLAQHHFQQKGNQPTLLQSPMAQAHRHCRQ